MVTGVKVTVWGVTLSLTVKLPYSLVGRSTYLRTTGVTPGTGAVPPDEPGTLL